MHWIAANTRRGAGGHLAWLGSAAVLGFLVSSLSVGLASVPRDWFVLVHLLITGSFLAGYAGWSGFGLPELLHHWRLGLALGAGAALFSVGFVLSEPGSSGPVGVDRAWAVVWLGLLYGVIDTLLLTVLPVHAVFRVGQRRGWLQRWPGWVWTAGLALIASIIVTIVYHLGFPEFRGPEVLHPVIGNSVFTLAYVFSGSLLAPLIGHVALHVTAVIHAYGSSVPLPPHY